MRFYILLFILSASLLFSCKSKTGAGDDTASAVLVLQERTDSSISKYGIKSGIIDYISSMRGREARQRLSFDEFGREERTETETEVHGLKITTVSVEKDGYVFTFNPATGRGTKVAQLGRQSYNINFRNLSEEMRRKMNLELTDTVIYDGKECLRYTADWVEMSLKGTYLVWQGIILNSDITVGNISMQMNATNIKEDAEIPASLFTVPPDIKLN